MLRVSATTTETTIDLQGINGDAAAAATGVQYGAELMAFAEALAKRDEQLLAEARQSLLNAAGAAVLVDAAGVAGNFQRMVRIADSMGIPVDNMQAEFGQQVRQELNLARFESAANSLA
jgi:hypothetical protein